MNDFKTDRNDLMMMMKGINIQAMRIYSRAASHCSHLNKTKKSRFGWTIGGDIEHSCAVSLRSTFECCIKVMCKFRFSLINKHSNDWVVTSRFIASLYECLHAHPAMFLYRRSYYYPSGQQQTIKLFNSYKNCIPHVSVQ